MSACCIGLACMRFDERHPGLLQIEGGIAIAARLRRAPRRSEVRRKFHVGRGGTSPAPRRIIIAIFDLVNGHLVDVSAFQRFRHLTYRIETRCIGLSQCGSASPQSPCSRPPLFPRLSWPPGCSGVRAGTKHSSPAAQGIVRIPSVRCALRVRVFSQQQQ